MIPRATVSVLRLVRTQLRPRGPTSVASLSALARLLSSLVVLEQRDGKLNHGSLGAVTAAQKLGGSITGFVAGGNIKAVAEEAAKVSGIEKIIAVENAAYDKVQFSDIVLLNVYSHGPFRAYQRTLLLYLLKISRREDLHILLPDIQHLERVSCPALQPY